MRFMHIVETSTGLQVNILAADGKTVVAMLKQGSFFGERSLITNEV